MNKSEQSMLSAGAEAKKLPADPNKEKKLIAQLKDINKGNKTAEEIITNVEEPAQIIEEMKYRVQNRARLEIASIGFSEEKKNEYYQLIQDIIDSKSASIQDGQSYDEYVSEQIRWMTDNGKNVNDFVKSVEEKLQEDVDRAIAEKMSQEMPTN